MREHGFKPEDPAFVADPYSAYASLRGAGRVLHDRATDRWLVPHHRDVVALLRDKRLGRSYLHVATHAEMGRPEDPPELAPFWKLIRAGILDMEPPDHTRVRRLIVRAFTPKRVEELRPAVERIVDRLLDAVSG
ncbi:MAG: cytochrome P450, partial [Polyangiales bacterium]